jgi:hypothetical protein
VAGIPRDERRTGNEAHSCLHRITHVDPATAGSQLAKQRTGSHARVPGHAEAGSAQKYVSLLRGSLVFATEHKLEGRDGCDPEREACAELPHQVAPRAASAEVVDQYVGV